MYSLDVYSDDFFKDNSVYTAPFDNWFSKSLSEVCGFKSIVDFGCSTGHFLKEVMNNEITVDVQGVEGSPNAFTNLVIDKSLIIQHDLRLPLVLNRKYDLCTCMEVAEHLEDEYADTFVKTLTDSSDVVFITAAIPGQLGHYHVNEQPKEYWIEKFAKVGYKYDEAAVTLLRQKMNEQKELGKLLPPWYEEKWASLLIFKK